MFDMSPSEQVETNWWRRIGLAAGFVVALVLAYAAIYRWVMISFEGYETLPYLQAVQVVVESLTTAGFGGHAPWDSTVANALILVMNLSGVALVFLAIPLFATPLLRQIFQRQVPTECDLEGHIIVCGYSEKDEILRKELELHESEVGREFPFLYVEPEEEMVRELIDAGIRAIHGDPERVETLRAANADKAATLVADVDDETNPSVVLAAKLIDEELPVISVVRDRRVANHHEYAGADRVIKARESFGKSLAIRASSSYAEKFREAVSFEDAVEVTELVVEDGSQLVGQTLREAELFSGDGQESNVIAAWVGGKFLMSPDPDTPIGKNSILVVAGKIDRLEGNGLHIIPGRTRRSSRVVIAGYGTVGRTVRAALEEAGIETTVIDLNEKAIKRICEDNEPGESGLPPGIHGDITDESTIERARIDEADSVVLSLDRDIPTIYAAILMRHKAPDVEVIGRAAQPGSISTLYQAGADFVLSLAAVTGEILAAELMELLGEHSGFLPASTEFQFERIDGDVFAGHSLADIDIRRHTNCTVAAIERGGELYTHVRGGFVVESDDVLVIAGSHRAIDRFTDEFLPSWLDSHPELQTESNGEDDEDGDAPDAGDEDETSVDEPPNSDSDNSTDENSETAADDNDSEDTSSDGGPPADDDDKPADEPSDEASETDGEKT